MSTTDTPALLTPAQVADRLGVSRVTVYRAIREQRLRAYRLGGDFGPLRVRVEDVRSLLRPATGSGRGTVEGGRDVTPALRPVEAAAVGAAAAPVAADRERQRTAWHEAGHATAAFLLGARISGPVSIRPARAWGGVAFVASTYPPGDRERARRAVEQADPAPLWPPRVRRALEVDVLVSLAGAHTEKLLPPAPEPEPGAGDVAPRVEAGRRDRPAPAPVLPAREALMLARGDSEERPLPTDVERAYTAAELLTGPGRGDRLVAWLDEETRRLVGSARFRRLADALARELLARETLSAAAARRVLRAADVIPTERTA